jgi:hypothetical protein
MADQPLIRTQANQVLGAIRAAGLAARDRSSEHARIATAPGWRAVRRIAGVCGMGDTGTLDGAEGHVNVHNLNNEETLSRDTIVLLG